jgi:hypothetical protein
MNDMKDDAVEKILFNLSELRSTLLSSLVPEEAREHFLTSRKEALLGMQVLLQHAIDRCDEQIANHSQQGKPSSRSIEITE